MDINLLAVISAAIAQFAFGAVWYTFIFGKTWGKMHGFDKLTKAKQKEMTSQMGPIYGAQFAVTFLGALGLAKLISIVPDYNAYTLALVAWLAFAVPAHVADVLFGGTDSKWIIPKILLTSFATLGYLIVAVSVFKLYN